MDRAGRAPRRTLLRAQDPPLVQRRALGGAPTNPGTSLLCVLEDGGGRWGQEKELVQPHQTNEAKLE